MNQLIGGQERRRQHCLCQGQFVLGVGPVWDLCEWLHTHDLDVAPTHYATHVLGVFGAAIGSGVCVPGDVLEPTDRVVAETVVVGGRRRKRRVQGQ